MAPTKRRTFSRRGGRQGWRGHPLAGRAWLVSQPRSVQEIAGLIIQCRVTRAASAAEVTREVSSVLQRRAELPAPPVSIAVSDAVALGIAELFRGPTATGQVMDYFLRTGLIDSAELIQAARFEQDYASPEGHAALYCLIGWARSREHRSQPVGS